MRDPNSINADTGCGAWHKWALESTVTAEMVQQDTLAMSDGVLGTVNGATKFLSSITVGVLWTAFPPVLGFGIAAGMMAAGTLAYCVSSAALDQLSITLNCD